MLAVREAIPEVVEEHRLDDLQDVRLGRVVLAQLTTCTLVLHRLEQRSEDRWADRGPVELARGEQPAAHRRVEGGDAQCLVEDPAVDVGEPGDERVQVALPFFWRRAMTWYKNESCEPRSEPSCAVRVSRNS